MDEEPTDSLVRRIEEGSIDGALLSTPSHCPGQLVEKPLFFEPFFLFAGSGHPLLAAAEVTPAQISAEEILLLDDAHCLRDQVLGLCRARGAGAKAAIQLKSGSLHTLVELIRLEGGYTLLPYLSLGLLNARERTANVRPFVASGPTPSRKVSLVYHSARLKRSLIDAIAEQVESGLPAHLPRRSAGLKVLPPRRGHFQS